MEELLHEQWYHALQSYWFAFIQHERHKSNPKLSVATGINFYHVSKKLEEVGFQLEEFLHNKYN